MNTAPTIFAIVDRIADEMEEVRVNMLALEYDRFKGYPDEKAIQKQMQTYRHLRQRRQTSTKKSWTKSVWASDPRRKKKCKSVYPISTAIAKIISSAQAKMRLPSVLESSLRILKSKNPINRLFLLRVGSEVGRRKMIATRDNKLEHCPHIRQVWG